MFVADPGLGNILNFNVGTNVDLAVPKVRGSGFRVGKGEVEGGLLYGYCVRVVSYFLEVMGGGKD